MFREQAAPHFETVLGVGVKAVIDLGFQPATKFLFWNIGRKPLARLVSE